MKNQPEQKNPEQVVKPLSVKNYLEGLNCLHDQHGSTVFSYSEDFYSLLPGQMDWIDQCLPDWAASLNAKSGGRVISLRLKRPASESFVSTITLELVVPGGILPACNPKMAKIISGGIKKQLAMEIKERFPIPFDCRKQYCFFRAGSLDRYFITPPNNVCFEDKDFSVCSKEEIIRIAAQTIEASEAKLVTFLFNSMEDMSEKSYLLLRWKNDATPEDRHSLSRALKKALEKAGEFNSRFDVYIGEVK